MLLQHGIEIGSANLIKLFAYMGYVGDALMAKF